MDPTSDPDIRLQLDDVDEEFDVALYKAENDSLRSLNDALQQQITLARGKAVAHADISKVVNSVLSEYESSYRKSTLFQNIAHIYNYLNAGHDPNADTITETMTRLGKAILRESRIKDDTMVKQYVDLDPAMNFSLNELQRIVEESKKAEEGYKKLDEMNLYELQNVEKVVSALNNMVQYANALRYNEHYKHVDEASDEALRELKPMEDKRIYDGFKGAVQNFAQYEMLDSYSFFSGLGKTSRSIQTKTILPPQPIRWNGHRRRCSKTRAQPAQETVKHTHSGSCSF